MRAIWVLAGSSATQQHPVSGSYELVGDPRIQLAGGSLHFVMSRVMTKGDLVHLGFNTWEIIETSTAWRGKLILMLLKVEIGSGGVGPRTLASWRYPGKMILAFTFFRHRAPGEGDTVCARWGVCHSQSTAKYVIVRVAQRQHGGTSLRLMGDPSITTLHDSITFRDELATTGGDHADLPLGLSESLME